MLTGEEIARLGIVTADHAGRLPTMAIQPNGIDLSLDAVWRVMGGGVLGVDADNRRLPDREPLLFNAEGWVSLPAGTYGIRFGETVRIPVDCGGLAFPRSSILRMGAHIPTAVWDAGYCGRAEALLITTATELRLEQSARMAQLVLFRLTAVTVPYAGRYQGENLSSRHPTTG